MLNIQFFQCSLLPLTLQTTSLQIKNKTDIYTNSSYPNIFGSINILTDKYKKILYTINNFSELNYFSL